MGVSHSAYGGGRNLFGLAPGGVYQATPIAQGTGELLPRLFTLTLWNGAYAYSTGRYISVALSLPCEIRDESAHTTYFTEQSALRTTLPCGARTFLPPFSL